MLDHEDSDNITNFPTSLNNRGAMVPPAPPPPGATARNKSLVSVDIRTQQISDRDCTFQEEKYKHMG
jgi:hypothetical protein